MRGVHDPSPGRDAIVAEDRPRHEDAGNVTVPRVFLLTSRASQTRNRLLGAYRDPNIGSAFPDLGLRPQKRAGSVTFPASSSRLRHGPGLPGPDLAVFRAERSRKWKSVSDFCRTPASPPSRASRGGHSLPGPPRDARDAPRTAGAPSKHAASTPDAASRTPATLRKTPRTARRPRKRDGRPLISHQATARAARGLISSGRFCCDSGRAPC